MTQRSPVFILFLNIISASHFLLLKSVLKKYSILNFFFLWLSFYKLNAAHSATA